MKRNTYRTYILCVCAALGLGGCSMLGDDLNKTLWDSQTEPGTATTKDAAVQTTKVPVEPMKDKTRTSSEVEVIWEIPEKPVEGYIIKYGFDSNNLDQEIKLPAEALEKFDDKQHGFVYRHILSGVPISKTVYISIAAYQGETISDSSRVIEVSGQN